MASFSSTTTSKPPPTKKDRPTPPRPKLLGPISSDLTALDGLHALGGGNYYTWIPNSSTVRPTEAGKALKHDRLTNITATYATFADYILSSVFGKALVAGEGGLLHALVDKPAPQPVTSADGGDAVTHDSKLPATVLKLDIAVSSTSETLSEKGGGVGGVAVTLPEKGAVTIPPTTNSVEMRFLPNEFPYAIEAGHHYVMWYDSPHKPKSDELITADIYESLLSMHDGVECFDFAYYANPKMTVPEFYHVQVFWTKLSPPEA